jgi:hypothetical protein
MAKKVAYARLPRPPLEAQIIPWGRDRDMHRVHESAYLPATFNPSAKGNARFSPIRDSDGNIIPTMYAATSLQGALMETIFHDVPYRKGLKTVFKTRLADKFYSTVRFHAEFQFIDLNKVALRRMGMKPEHLITTTKAHYPETRLWAEALYIHFPSAQGLLWTSRQDDRSLAVVLFGTRVKPSDLSAHGSSQALMTGRKVWDPVEKLATDMEVILN